MPIAYDRLLEEGVDLSALMEPKPDEGSTGGAAGQRPPDAKEPPTPWWRRWCRRQQKEADPNAEVLELYSKATRALVWRACTLLVSYYLPNYALQAWLASYKVRCVWDPAAVDRPRDNIIRTS